MLRIAISQLHESDTTQHNVGVLLAPIQDIAWALMRFRELSTSAPLPANSAIRSTAWTQYSRRVFELARLWLNRLAPKHLSGDRQLDSAGVHVPHPDLGSRERIALLDQVARLPQP
jgi:hypothetical protein